MLVIEPDIRLVINICWENGLCVTAPLPEGRRMQFTSNEFVEVDGERPRHQYASPQPDLFTLLL